MRIRSRGIALACTLLASCRADTSTETVEVFVPQGATLSAVADSLANHGVIHRVHLFTLYAQVRGAARNIKAGHYAISTTASWASLLTSLTEGRVETVPVTIPEGFRLPQIAGRIAGVTEVTPDSVLAELREPGAAASLGVPGPGLEGYLFPDTYRFASGVPLNTVLKTMVARYQRTWTAERIARRDSLGATEREVVTLASIIQAEAVRTEEMPTISAVYWNRLRLNLALQADPTVIYALGAPRERLLFASIDSVADDPYNTYTHPGLPPGPIGAPGEAAIDAALDPADVDYLYFVAWPDGSHVFTRTLAEHNRAKEEARRERDRLERNTGTEESGGNAGAEG